MNRFISYLKVILGIALTLNLSLSTALFADPPGDSENNFDPAWAMVYAPVFENPLDLQGDYLVLNQMPHVDLMSVMGPHGLETFELTVQESLPGIRVTSTDIIEPFTFQVVRYHPIPLQEIIVEAQPPQEVTDFWLEFGYQFAVLEGTVHGPLGSVNVSTYLVGTNVMSSYGEMDVVPVGFALSPEELALRVEYEDAKRALVQELLELGGQGQKQCSGAPSSVSPGPVIPPPAWNVCLAWLNCVTKANRDFNNALNTESSLAQICVNGCTDASWLRMGACAFACAADPTKAVCVACLVGNACMQVQCSEVCTQIFNAKAAGILAKYRSDLAACGPLPQGCVFSY